MSNSILRQLKDIQVQAERLLSYESSPEDYQNFAKYSNEIKTFLLENVDEEMILKYVNEIPDLDDFFGIESGNTWMIAQGIGHSLGNWSKKSSDEQLLRDTKDKYASVEFLCKNYFS